MYKRQGVKMGLPIAAVEVGIADGVATMEHPAVAHIDAHMRNLSLIHIFQEIKPVPKEIFS